MDNRDTMKLSNFFQKLVFIVSVNAAITACSTITHDQKDIKLDRFSHINTQNNKVFHKQIQLNKQELKSSNIIYFPLDKYDIPSQFFYILNIHANFLYNNPSYCIRIEGHADERGTSEYNIALGERRARSVKLYLQSKGVLSEQMLIVSYGKEKPAVLGHNEEAYSKNRRVILIYK